MTQQEAPGLFRRLLDAFRPPESIQANIQRDKDGQWLVPAGTDISQILDYFSGGEGPWDTTRPITRDRALTYATMHRCIALISGVLSRLITSPAMRVVGPDGKRQTSRRVDKALEILYTSPDSGLTPSHSFFEAAIADYCFDGNSLIVPTISSDGTLMRLRRMSPDPSEIIYSSTGLPVYRLVSTDGSARTEMAAARDVIHVKWPETIGHGRGGNSKRVGFAPAPLAALRRSLDIGLRGDEYTLNWFDSGSKSKTHFNLDRGPNVFELLDPEEREKIVEAIRKQAKTGSPIITEHMTSSRIDDQPQDSEALKLREFQVMEVLRVYGVPPPIIGSMVTEWGEGLGVMFKFFYLTCIKQHMERFLAAMQLLILPRHHFFLPDPTEFLRGDYEATAKFITALKGDAQRPEDATREERRHIAGLPADPEGTLQDYPENTDTGSNNGRPQPGPEPMPMPF